MAELSHPYVTTGKTAALTRQTFVKKVMSLLFNILSKICHSFPSKEQESLNFMATVIIHSGFGAQENVTVSTFPLLPLSDGAGCHDLSFLNIGV